MHEDRKGVSRRGFVSGAVLGTAGLWIHATLPRPLAAAEARNDPEPRTLDALEWALVESITGRILPTDDTPGAIEAGCVNFIDKALANEDAEALPLYRVALAELERLSRRRAGVGFVELDEVVQDRLLSELEAGEIEGWSAPETSPEDFFQSIRLHTILGFVLDPSHGGNRDYAGWKAMGFPGPVHHLGGSRPAHMLGEERFIPIWERESPAHQERDVPGEAPSVHGGAQGLSEREAGTR